MAIKNVFYIAAFLTCCAVITKDAAKQKNTTVLILGGGISGIAAAKTLSDHGIKDFIILEGTDRIGGRMRKMQFFNTTIELGANWIQGVKNNPITDLALICGLKGKLENGNFVIRNESGFNTTMKGNMAQLKRAEEILNKIRLHRRKRHKGDISIRVALRLANWLPVTPEEDATEYFQYDFEYAVPPKIHLSKNMDRGQWEYSLSWWRAVLCNRLQGVCSHCGLSCGYVSGTKGSKIAIELNSDGSKME